MLGEQLGVDVPVGKTVAVGVAYGPAKDVAMHYEC